MVCDSVTDHNSVCVCVCVPTRHQLQLLSRVALSVEFGVAAVADLADEASGQRHQVPSDQHTVPVLRGQRHGRHLWLVLD